MYGDVEHPGTRKILHAEWKAEQKRLKERFAEAQVLYKKLEEREVLLTSQKHLSEDQLKEWATTSEEEKKEVRTDRKNEARAAAQKQENYQERLLNSIEEMTAVMKQSNQADTQLFALVADRFDWHRKQ